MAAGGREVGTDPRPLRQSCRYGGRVWVQSGPTPWDRLSGGRYASTAEAEPAGQDDRDEARNGQRDARGLGDRGDRRGVGAAGAPVAPSAAVIATAARRRAAGGVGIERDQRRDD